MATAVTPVVAESGATAVTAGTVAQAGTAEIIIAKQRSGPTGKIKTAFLGKYTRFDNLAPEYMYNT